jgi:diaminopimelate epimerase
VIIPFAKAHGAQNDFLLTWRERVQVSDLSVAARAICHRHTGVGADGWLLVEPGIGGEDGAIALYNSDGSPAEMSGNGTRCAAAFLIDAGLARDRVRIRTGAGVKSLSLIERRGKHFLFEMNMGAAYYSERELGFPLKLSAGEREVTILNVGNPQCAVFVRDFDFDWRQTGREIESHSHFPHRTNVSFVRVAGPHIIDVRFYERGAGETMSSGTGSTGAAAAAILRGLVTSPVRVLTPAGPLELREENGEYYLQGPAEITAAGEYYSES